MLRRIAILTACFAGAAVALTTPAHAATCTVEEFGEVVDGAGRSLRALNTEQQPRLERALADLAEAERWSNADYAQNARALVEDDTVRGLDAKAGELLAAIDRLGAIDAGAAPDCARLRELRTSADELNTTLRDKWAYMFGRVEAAITEADAAAAGPADGDGSEAERPKIPAIGAGDEKPETPPKQLAATTEPGPTPDTVAGWGAVAVPDALFEVPPSPPPPDAGLLEALPTAASGSFSISEIQGASRGFFGAVSNELASVIEYSFQKLGRPSGYILGNDGGASVLAGVRYGKGRLHTPGGAWRIYWQGPSIGLDLGLEGGKTLMLVYNLDRPAGVLKGFGGVTGSAYVVGGVGVTFLTDGNVVVAPIRSGFGLRLGASLGYLKFTHEETWNPF